MEIIKAYDMFPLFRISGMKIHLAKVEESISSTQKAFDHLVDSEACSVYELNAMADQQEMNKSLLVGLRNQIKDITLSVLN